jgi:oligoendopeptidase F
MENEEKLLKRSEVPENLKWDLTLLYKTNADALKDADRMCEMAKAIEAKYFDKLTDSASIAGCMDESIPLYEIRDLLINFAELVSATDYTDSEAQDVQNRVQNAIVETDSRMSFVSSQIELQPEAVISEAMKLTERSRLALAEILRGKPHKLGPETEKALALLSRSFELPYNGYNQIKFGDMEFPQLCVNGKKYPFGYAMFEDDYEYCPDMEIRHEAFRVFSETLSKYRHGTAAMYNGEVQRQKAEADLRGFANVYDYLLFDQHVERELYDRQIDLIMTELAPHMRKYAKLLQHIHGLSKMTYADLKITVDPKYDPSVTIESARDYIEKGLAIMGDDYLKMIGEAFDKRWVDFAKNAGKCTGGFCCSPYRHGSFILMSWNDKMSDVFTLAHELGHAGHFKACGEAQSVYDTDVSRYMVEAPSTMNELLMANYLASTATDKRFRRWVLACMVANTYYHNFVTHLLEAAYQREVYRIVGEGGMVNADALDSIYRDVLTQFWGDAVEIVPGAEMTWMRQPHYYMGLYSYTYSAGLTVATEVARRIEREGSAAAEDWKKVLRAGSTLDPKGLAMLAGIDISTDKPLKDTIAYIGGLIDEICALTDEIENG